MAQSVQLEKWAICPTSKSFYLQGVRLDGKEKYDFHTAPVVKDAHLKGELRDEEGNKVALVGPADEHEQKQQGLSEMFRHEYSTAAAVAKPEIYKDLVKERASILLKRELSTLNWRELPFIGVELKSIADIYAEHYEFPDFAREITSGVLFNLGRPIYAFLGAQPVYIGETVKNLPYLVVIDCKNPPPSQLAHHSLQAGKEEIIEMKNTKVDWIPYVPKATRGNRGSEKLPIVIYALDWKERKTNIKNYNEEKLHWHEYLLPYIALPQLVEKEEFKDVTQVSFDYSYEGKPYPIIFDKEIDRLATFIPDWIEENKIPEGESDKIKEAIRAAFQEKRAKERAQYDEQQARVKDLTPEAREALKNIRLFKFYPTHPTLDVKAFADPKINAYYGNATQIFVPEKSATPAPAPELADSGKKRKVDTPRKETAKQAASPRGRGKRGHTETEADAAPAAPATPAAPAATTAPVYAESASEEPSVQEDGEKVKKRGRTASPRAASSRSPKRSGRLEKGKPSEEALAAEPAAPAAPAPAPAAATPAMPTTLSFGVGTTPVAISSTPAAAPAPATAPTATGSFSFGVGSTSSAAAPPAGSFSFGVAPAAAGSATGSFSFSTSGSASAAAAAAPTAAAPAAAAAPFVGGFVFGAGTAPVVPAAAAAPSASWKCPCCDNFNPLSAASCGVCMVAKPK